ncbi:helix-hairpin-helix domain-containing protein [bacterium]|nr:helix-hairpin-helix domain-containing protein [bacterium]
MNLFLGTASRRGRSAVAGLALVILAGWLGAFGAVPIASAAAVPSHVDLVDLNTASLEEVMTLPIPEDVARAIIEYRTYQRYFDNVYELLEVDGVTPSLFARIKDLVATIPPGDEDPSIARLSASYRQVQNYLGQEGASEGLVDEYLDRLRNPEDINEMDLWDLMSYQNVSPVDATNIIKARDRLGRIESGRQLRRAEGLRYFAYRNLRDFVVYSEEEKEEESSSDVSGYVQTRYWETPYAAGDEEGVTDLLRNQDIGLTGGTGYFVYPPAWLNKARVNIKGGYQVGALTTQEYGEQDWNETAKSYAGVFNKRFGDFRLKSAVIGNYRVAFGLGLVMDNTDYIHFRKTGFGFNKRMLGVHGDLSRSYEYSLKGGAVEGSYGPLNATFFYSKDRKDGILNRDGTINRYVTMRPRFEEEIFENRFYGNGSAAESGMLRDAFEEKMVGGNVKLSLAPGTFIGVTGYEARYDRGFDSDINTLVLATDLIEARDNEISQGYTSVYTDENGDRQEAKFRRVMGAEAQAVYGNMSLQGEYAFLQNPQNDFFSSKNPDAFVVNAFSQWDNLHLLAIYRDYDVGFDNPYGRAFSNDSKYEMTLLDSYFRLNDPLYSWLELEGAQPKAEKGLFLDARYRISRTLILSGLSFDQWTRKADGADLMRYTIKGEYQPIFNLRFRVRHRYSSRSEADPTDVRKFQNWETRWQMIGLLSNYNRIQFTYVTSNVMFPPRPRLSGTAEAGVGDPAVGGNGLPAHAFEVKYEHNLTPGIKFTLASAVYEGFFWNFEGNEFVLLDANGFRNWFKVESRVSERLLFQLKITRDHNLPRAVDVRQFGDPSGLEPDAPYVPQDQTTVRLQMDYTF